MGYTNTTTYLKLPQWTDVDCPDWLTDVNEAFYNIDKGVGDNKTDLELVEQNVTNITGNVNDLTPRLVNLENQYRNQDTDIKQLQIDVTNTNNNITTINTELQTADARIESNEDAITNLNNKLGNNILKTNISIPSGNEFATGQITYSVINNICIVFASNFHFLKSGAGVGKILLPANSLPIPAQNIPVTFTLSSVYYINPVFIVITENGGLNYSQQLSGDALTKTDLRGYITYPIKYN